MHETFTLSNNSITWFVRILIGWALWLIGYSGNAQQTWEVQLDAYPLQRVQVFNSSKAYFQGQYTFGKTDNGGNRWLTSGSGDYLDLHFSDANTGWLVGRTGMINKTVDAGESWVNGGNAGSASPDWRSVFGLNAATAWVAGPANALYRTTNGGGVWSPGAIGGSMPTGQLNGVFFPSDSRGYIVGNSGVIIRTADGGVSWQTLTSGTTEHLNSVYFVDDDHGWVVGTTGTILYTSNGGSTWTPQNVAGVTVSLNSIHMISASNGWIVGSSSTFLKWNGSNWAVASSNVTGVGIGWKDVHFIADGSYGWAVSNTAGGQTAVYSGGAWAAGPTSLVSNTVWMVSATDGWMWGGGISPATTTVRRWNTPTTNTWNASSVSSNSIIQSLCMYDATQGWMVGNGGRIWRWNGTSWVSTSVPAGTPTLFGVYSRNGSTVWAVGLNGTIVKSTDGGANWSNYVSTAPVWDFNKVYFQNAANGWVVGNQGVLLQSTDGGANWSILLSGTTQHLWDITFVGTTGYTVGANGTVKKTTDGGTTWVDKSYGGSNTLLAAHFATTTTGWAVGSNGLIIKTTDGGTNWVVQNSGVSYTLNDIAFAADGLTGFAVGDHNTLLKTSDGGATWVKQSLGAQEPEWDGLADVYFTDTDHGWTVGADGVVLATTNSGLQWEVRRRPDHPVQNAIGFFSGAALSKGIVVGKNGTIKTTNDGGVNWLQRSSGTAQGLEDVYCLPGSTTAWAVGSSGAILKSTDYGASWSKQTVGTTTYNAVYFVDALNGYVVGNGGSFLKTTDGGANWSTQTLALAAGANLQTVHFINTSQGWVAGGSKILYTTNGGSTWNQQSLPARVGNGSITGIYFSDANKGSLIVNGDDNTMMSAAGMTLYTTNGGSSWTVTESIAVTYLNDLHFLDANIGFAVGDDGAILRTNNGGANWAVYGFLTQPWLNFHYLAGVHATTTNEVYVIGENDVIFKTTDGGSTATSWSPSSILSYKTGDLYAVHFTNQSTGFAGGHMGQLLKTTDGGVNWTVKSVGKTNAITEIDFASATTGLAVGHYGLIMKTTDAGENWTDMIPASLSRRHLNGLDMYDANLAIAVGDNGTILRSTNGGLSWQTIASPTSNNLNNVYFYDASTVWIAGNGGRILKSADGGLTWALTTITTSGNHINDVVGTSSIALVVSNYELLRSSDGGSTWPGYQNPFNAAGIATLGLGYSALAYRGGITWAVGGQNIIRSLSNAIVLPARWGVFSAHIEARSRSVLDWSTLQENNIKQFEIERSTNGNDWELLGFVGASNSAQGSSYRFTDYKPIVGQNYYRLKLVNDNNSFEYSKVVPLTYSKVNEIQVRPTLVTKGQLTITVAEGVAQVYIYNCQGALISQHGLQKGLNRLNFTGYAKGGYLVQVQDSSGTNTITKIDIQ